MATSDAALFKNMTATGSVKNGTGVLYGVIVNSNTSGTMKLWDSLSAAGTVIINTFTFTTGVSQTILFPFPINFVTGCFFTLGGTADVTFLYN